MSAMSAARAAISPETVARRAREIARLYAAEHGRKRGIALLGRLVGGERRARGFYAGEARRIEAHEYLALLQAEAALRRARAARLRDELATLETEDARMDMAAAGGAVGLVR